MNPVIVIPSYWTAEGARVAAAEAPTYDHATPVTAPTPELATCLASLEQVRGVLRVVVLLVAPAACEDSARARVDGICRAHPRLSPLVVGSPEAAAIERVVAAAAPGMAGAPVSLSGYGAIRNMGLAVAAALGHDVVVFLDDDEVALDERFLIDGTYGLGLSNRQGLPIVAKSGYFLDRADSPYADVDRPRWRDRPWSKRAEFNLLMRRLLAGTRITRTTYVCGGCFALAAGAFRKVGFDPYIPRGEDLDYLFNLRMNGLDVWFDNQWRVRHLPPKTQSHAARFQQDVYRWAYERMKLEAVNATIGLRHVTASSLAPYPGAWVGGQAERRARACALRRAVAGPERRAYLRILVRGIREARLWAAANARRYLAFQTYWPRIMDTLWDDAELARRLVASGTPFASPASGPLRGLADPRPAPAPAEAPLPGQLSPELGRHPLSAMDKNRAMDGFGESPRVSEQHPPSWQPPDTAPRPDDSSTACITSTEHPAAGGARRRAS